MADGCDIAESDGSAALGLTIVVLPRLSSAARRALKRGLATVIAAALPFAAAACGRPAEDDSPVLAADPTQPYAATLKAHPMSRCIFGSERYRATDEEVAGYVTLLESDRRLADGTDAVVSLYERQADGRTWNSITLSFRGPQDLGVYEQHVPELLDIGCDPEALPIRLVPPAA